MNITKKVVDDVNIILNLEIQKADYAAAVEKGIKDAAKQMQMPGFRKGMVPKSLVAKRFGVEIKVDEVNKINPGYKMIKKINLRHEELVKNTSKKVIRFSPANKEAN